MPSLIDGCLACSAAGPLKFAYASCSNSVANKGFRDRFSSSGAEDQVRRCSEQPCLNTMELLIYTNVATYGSLLIRRQMFGQRKPRLVEARSNLRPVTAMLDGATSYVGLFDWNWPSQEGRFSWKNCQ